MTTELNTQEVLKLFQTSKEQRESFVSAIISSLQNGESDPLEVHLQIKCMEDVVKLANANTVYKKTVLEAAERFGEKSFQFHNAKVEIKETGVKYDFSNCGDIVYNELQTQVDELSAKLKQRADFLKTIPQKGMIVTDESSGETFTVYPPSKSSTTNVAITLK